MVHHSPGDIERTSMAVIEKELLTRRISLAPENEAVVKRVLHATADFDFARNLRFTPGAVEKGVKALLQGAAVVTDTQMAASGVSKPALGKLGCPLRCYMAEEETARLARQRGVTRAVVSMERAASEYPQGVFAVGNAPTALFSLSDAMEDGLRPALVIGVPVGFVNVVEGKERLWDVCRRRGVPAIVSMGRKGGSTVAAAVCNALLYTAAGALDPAKRGWD